MKTQPRIFDPVPDRTPRRFAATNTSLAFWSHESKNNIPQSSKFDAGAPMAPALIYAIDDMPCLTELYALVLEASGYRVRIFNHRHIAVAALRFEKPALLITDLHNPSMPLGPFLEECLALHPGLRILMATGFGQRHLAYCPVTPDRFLQKPFTPEELQREVRAALADMPAECAP